MPTYVFSVFTLDLLTINWYIIRDIGGYKIFPTYEQYKLERTSGLWAVEQ